MESIWYYPLGLYAVLAVGAVVTSVISKRNRPGWHAQDKHVFITGGSQGLGLSVAKRYLSAGAKVSIVSRKESLLQSAKSELESSCPDGPPIFTQSCDVCSLEAVQSAVENAQKFHEKSIDHLICCAGVAKPGYFEEQDVGIHHSTVKINYLGCVNTVKAALPHMQPGGQVVMVSSAAGIISFVGYQQYSMSKFALRGFAEALSKEMQPQGVHVRTFIPGNIDSPGYAEENKTKPKETTIIEGPSDVEHPDKVAESLIQGMANGQYSIASDAAGYILRVLSNGGAPRDNTCLESLLSPVLVAFQVLYGVFMDATVVYYGRSRKPKQA